MERLARFNVGGQANSPSATQDESVMSAMNDNVCKYEIQYTVAPPSVKVGLSIAVSCMRNGFPKNVATFAGREV